MLRRIASLNSLRAFEAAGRRMSFTKAAEELHITQGAISYQIRQLESQLGIKLFHRAIRKVSLTDAGERLYKVTRRALLNIDAEVRALSPDQKQASLSIAVSTYFATRWLSKRLNGFLDAHPEITLKLHHDVNTPEFEVGMYDLAIRWGRVPWNGAASCELLSMTMAPACAPAMMRDGGDLVRTDDLQYVTLLRDQENVDLWPAWLEKAGVVPESVGAGRMIADPVVRIQAAVDGQGVVLTDDLVADEVAHGRLVIPFDIVLEGYGFHLLWARDAEPTKSAMDFRNWILAQTRVGAAA